MSRFIHLVNFVLILGLLGFVASCDKKGEGSKASQSIVRVNGDEITILQLNAELERANVKPSQQDELGKRIVDTLIDQQIVLQQAREAKLDRNPKVMQAMEAAKAKVLTQAYILNKVSTLPRPTDAEISAFIGNHAELFTERKAYVMDQIAFQSVDGMESEFKTLSNTSQTLEDVTQWLESHQIKFIRNHATYYAEIIPAELLAKLSHMTIGELIFLNSDEGHAVGVMREINDEPIVGDNAKLLAERLLTEQKRKEVINDEVKRLRSTANIEYLNKMFEPKTKDSSTNIVDSPSVVNNQDTVVNNDVQKPVTEPKKVERYIEKGVSGL